MNQIAMCSLAGLARFTRFHTPCPVLVCPVLIGWLVSLKLPMEQNFMAIGLAGLNGAAAVTLINQTRADSHRSNSAPVVAVQGNAGH